jgi:hypothetical protein
VYVARFDAEQPYYLEKPVLESIRPRFRYKE